MSDLTGVGGFAFAEPQLVWLVLLAPATGALAAWLWRRRLQASAAWAARGLWTRLYTSYRRGRLIVSVTLLSVAVAGTALALARPRWGAARQEVERQGADVVFVLDSSLSMGARDLEPDRLFVAETLIRRLMAAMPQHRIALVQMEGLAEVLAPLTFDRSVIELLLDTVEPGSLDRPGTLLEPALATAAQLFLPGAETHRVIVLISDGEHHGDALGPTSERLAGAGVVVHTLGVGSLEGAPVPVPDPEEGRLVYKRDDRGERVVSRLGEGVLESLARSTGGVYLRVSGPGTDLSPVVQRIERMDRGPLGGRTFGRQPMEREERYQWPLAASVLALLVYLSTGPFRPRRRDGPSGEVRR